MRAGPVGVRQPLARHRRDPPPVSRGRPADPGRGGAGRAARPLPRPVRPGRLALAERTAGDRDLPGAAAPAQGADPRRGDLGPRRGHPRPAVRRRPHPDQRGRGGAVHLAPDGRGDRDRRPGHGAPLGRVGRHPGPRRGQDRPPGRADDRRRAPRPGGGRGLRRDRVRRRRAGRRRPRPAGGRDRRPGRARGPGPGRLPAGAARPGHRLRGQGPARGVDLPAIDCSGKLHRRHPR